MWLGRGVTHPALSTAEVKERVEIFPYSLSGPVSFYVYMCVWLRNDYLLLLAAVSSW
jgi:hypothetical protein